MKLQDNFKMNESISIMRGKVQLIDKDGNIELEKDNVITDYFRQVLMGILFKQISTVLSSLDTVTNNSDSVGIFNMNDIENGYISGIKFGAGTGSNLSAKSSKTDSKLAAPIPDTLSDESGEDLYINTGIEDGLRVDFDFNELSIKFSGDLINNDNRTYIIGELGIFYNTSTTDEKLLTHLYFDPIFFEPDTTKKIIYTIYFY